MSEPRPLEKKVAIVTGGASGIGRATCVALARAGAAVAVVDVDTAGIDGTAGLLEQEGADALGLRLDVRAEADMTAMAESTARRLGDPDILVTCAGLLRTEPSPRAVDRLTTAEWDQIVATNLTGTFLANRAVLRPMMARRSGQIVNVSSMSGRRGRALDAPYCATKFGVIGFTESLAEEVRRYGIRVQVVLPDVVATPLWDQNGPIPPPADALPPERVAEFITYLVTLPPDTVLFSPVLARFSDGRRRARPLS